MGCYERVAKGAAVDVDDCVVRVRRRGSGDVEVEGLEGCLILWKNRGSWQNKKGSFVGIRDIRPTKRDEN